MVDKERKIFSGAFCLKNKIGAGSFGEIFAGSLFIQEFKLQLDYLSQLKWYQPYKEPTNSQYSQLFYEYKVYRHIAGEGIPNIISYGVESSYNIMVMELLGSNIEDQFNAHNRKLPIKCVIQLAKQMLKRIEHIHTQNFIHRDIKPDNFCIGKNNNAFLYLIDFGLSKRFRNPKSGQHITMKEHKNLTGTARYASLNAHLGMEQSRRDDLESLGVVIVYLLKGSVPWQGLCAPTVEERFKKILETKLSTTSEKLCSNLPKQILDYFNLVRRLEFEEAPNYAYLYGLFDSILIGEPNDKVCWPPIIEIITNIPLRTQIHSTTTDPKKSEISNRPNEITKSNYGLSADGKTDRSKAISKNQDTKSGLIQIPYMDSFNNKALLDKKYLSSNVLKKYEDKRRTIDEIPQELETNIAIHFPLQSSIIHHKTNNYNKYQLK